MQKVNCGRWEEVEDFENDNKTISFYCITAKTYNDTCIESEQCKPLLGDKASCNDNKCNCDESLHFKGEQCNDKKGLKIIIKIFPIQKIQFPVSELDERCSKSAECFVPVDPESVECRNGVCQCKFNYATDTTQNRCVRPREKSKK